MIIRGTIILIIGNDWHNNKVFITSDKHFVIVIIKKYQNKEVEKNDTNDNYINIKNIDNKNNNND